MQSALTLNQKRCHFKWNEELRYLGRNLTHAHISYLDWTFSRMCTASPETPLPILCFKIALITYFYKDCQKLNHFEWHLLTFVFWLTGARNGTAVVTENNDASYISTGTSSQVQRFKNLVQVFLENSITCTCF